ncbi:MAG TPA: adenylate/guanylate cyclase domain-containing protein [Candidatus Limnocylindria bacterium]|nr:adenylate/guanylate cyclase domain-containing protein [Candidatus Limnocylindria bacterium]
MRETRKTVTVLFIDAVSSTALGERMDPESMRAVMTMYFDVMRDAIESHGGVIEKFIGDAVMAIFGVPVVHEDDALRACRAAIEIRGRLSELEPRMRAERGVVIEWRAGINTGQVVAGDVAAGQRIVTGDTVNVAARLEAAAAPGEILLGAETYALVRNAVLSEPVEALALKGKSERVPAWRLTGVSDSVGRHVRPSDAPLVGRLRPLRHLEDAFREAVEERICHLFTIVGAAGVGKSRVVEEFIGSVGNQAQVASGRCLAYGQGITYWPVTEAIRSGAGIADEDPSEAALTRLGEILQAEPEAERVAAIVGGLLGIQDAPPVPDEIFWAIRKTFEALARKRPLILVFDDIHWGEPTFLDLIEHIADWTRDAPILLIVMARAELLEKRPTWGGGKRWVTTMSLEPLSEVESAELVSSLLGRAELPAEFRTHISQAAEGNPLFVEELLAKLIDDGFLVRSNGGWVAPADLRQLTLPPTIQALLAARLDGLNSEERSVIERAAVEGKVFHRGAVTDLTPEPMRGQVRDRLASLMRMELVRPEQASFAGDEAYRFRHLLIRDAAYQALAKQTRSELHERFAAWLERVATDRLPEYQEIVAYHLEQAYRYRIELGPADARAEELAIRAGTLLADAGERADARGDVAATVDLLDRAVELLPDELPRRRRLLYTLGIRLPEAGDAPRAERILSEAFAEAGGAGDEGASALAELGLLTVRASTRSTELTESIRDAERLAATLARAGEESGARMAESWAAFLLFAVGHAGEAARRAAALVEMGAGDATWQREARGAQGVSLVFGPTPVEEAIAQIQAQIESAHGAKWNAGAHRGIGRLLVLQGRFAEARERNILARAAFEELGNRNQIADSINDAGEIEHRAGNLKAAAQLIRESFEAMISTGDRSYASTIAAGLGEVLLGLGEDDEALRFGMIARDTSSSDDVSSQAGGRAVQARVLSRRGEHEGAEALAREAEAIMARTDYLAHHGNVLVHLARVLHEAGKADEARAAAQEAETLFALKGATLLVERTRQLIEEWSAAPRG